MRDVLKLNSSIGNIQGILLFETKLFDENLTSLDAIKDIDKYELGIHINIPAAIAFFEYLELIVVQNKKITLSSKGLDLVHQSATQRNIIICSTILHMTIENNLVDINNIHISQETGEIFFDTNAFSLSAAVFRNFLISVKCLTLDNNKYIVDGKFEPYINTLIASKRKKITQEELLIQLEKKRDDGALAEELVLKYEKERLPSLSSKIKQISLFDVAAGYDILSYDSATSISYDRFIEVKSFHSKVHFYWTANEKNVSELIGLNYYIYLVDLDMYFRDPQNFKPIIIQDPSESINSSDWLIEANTFSVQKITGGY